jgi:hypothetical protein
VTPGVARRQRTALLVLCPRPDEALSACAGQGVNGVVEPALSECLRLAPPRAEACAPKQSLGLLWTELTPIDGNLGCCLRQK